MHLHALIHNLNVKGMPVSTGKSIMSDPDSERSVVYWGKGIAGIAEHFFPHPKEWRLGDIDKDLDKVQVRDLTAALIRLEAKLPTCFKSWGIKLPELDLRSVSERYSVGIATPKDFGSHYKLIMHGALLTNPHNPNAISPNCRLCGLARETRLHFG